MTKFMFFRASFWENQGGPLAPLFLPKACKG